jgi:hypothetical protein
MYINGHKSQKVCNLVTHRGFQTPDASGNPSTPREDDVAQKEPSVRLRPAKRPNFENGSVTRPTYM